MSFQELPEEIFEKVLSYLNFKTVQKTCTLVCRGWRQRIRDSSILSGEMKLNLLKIGASTWDEETSKEVFIKGKELDIETILSNWKKLHTLRIPCMMSSIDLSIYPHLTKVVTTSPLEWHQNLKVTKPPWLKVSEICYNPKNPIDGILGDQVIELILALKDSHIKDYEDLKANDPEQYLHGLDQTLSVMKNLESLQIHWDLTKLQDFQFLVPVFHGLGSCPNLKKIFVGFNSGPEASYPRILLIQLKEFFEEFVTHCPNILKLEIHEFDLYSYGEDVDESFVSWILSLKKLEELILSKVEVFPLDHYPKLFCENPMSKLRSLILDHSTIIFENMEFMLTLRIAFPALENFEYIGFALWVEGDENHPWEIDKFLSILEILGDVKKLSIEECHIPFPAYLDMVHSRKGSEKEEQKRLQLFNEAFEIIDKKFPKETTEIELREEQYGLWIKKEMGQSPVKYVPPSMKTWMSQTVPETQSSELSISEVISAGPEKGTILQTESGERIHLTPEMISKINDASITLQSSKRARMT